MGNCLKKDYDNQWGGDYWGSPATSPEEALLSCEPRSKGEKKLVAGDGDGDSDDLFSSSGGKRKRRTTEVKIKITKKQLEELLGMQEMQGLTLQQVLTQLMNSSSNINGGFESNQRPWRPALHSIPE
ncbi:uncharacterized protein LOC111897385 [Lactuca sativa]|uniref:Uncharacterized protein n=1 Tax=Lactuca sativa TaxID=4236 RepID=A0A9R1VJU6_LACSA|nr:uncharacterized protein LOC111897385 [Lactuca sativa]KAJ0207530.1 hypothetical protein LSAT_V11C500230220 [Lactuca sativa]